MISFLDPVIEVAGQMVVLVSSDDVLVDPTNAFIEDANLLAMQTNRLMDSADTSLEEMDEAV
ncbi:MAG TPA: hypothetical protein VFF73_39665 [Planctomycetota bacterium]|nr:hypothetical protein [Planctomycetota bacterium]